MLGLGGGSAIDSAKLIAVCIAENQRVWDIMKGEHEVRNAVPIIAVLTLPATGTEMNSIAVVQNNQEMEKLGSGHRTMFPGIPSWIQHIPLPSRETKLHMAYST